MPSKKHFAGKKRAKPRGLTSPLYLKHRAVHIQTETINNGRFAFAIPSGASNIGAVSIIDASGDSNSTLDTGFITETVIDSTTSPTCPRFDADLGSSVDSLDEASQPDLVKVPFSSKPSARSMNVAAATAMLVDMQDEGDDFNLDGYELDDDTEDDREPLHDSLATIEKKMLACPTPMEVNPDAGSYELIHSSFLKDLLSSLSCPTCNSLGLTYDIPFTQGMASKYVVKCENCADDNVFTGYTSPLVGKRRDINVRTVLGSRESGVSHPRLKTLFSLMNVAVPLCASTYDTISQEVHLASLKAAEDVQKEAAAYIAEQYRNGTFKSLNTAKSELGYPVTAVTFDGAWQTRGFSSHTGIGVACDLETGLCLDTEVMSNFCTGCLSAPEVDTPAFDMWKVQHKPKCSNNHLGSSGSMEMAAAVKIFNRSIEKLQLLFGTMLCDGDGKSFDKIKCDVCSYDIDCEKEDCVNHIAKRMYNALIKLKKSNPRLFNRRLTEYMICKITNTYATNLRRGAPSVEDMRQCVLGGVFHMAATDDTPNMHKYCATGPESWCGYQRAVAKNEKPPHHKPTYTPEILSAIYPTVQRLIEPELIKRCARMLTQNNNESFNSTVWKRAPKTEYRGKRSIETAVALAVLNFNCGAPGITRVLGNLNLQLNQRLKDHIDRRTAQAVSAARCKQKHLSKWKRKTLKLVNRTRDQKRATQEGVTYGAGEFSATV